MRAQTVEDVFSPQWVETHIINPTHDLVILRPIIPWQSIIDQLVPSSPPPKGRLGRSLRILGGVSMAARLRPLSDRTVIKEIQVSALWADFSRLSRTWLFRHADRPRRQLNPR